MDKLPKNWYVKVTYESREDIMQWRKDTAYSYSNNAGYGMLNGRLAAHGNPKNQHAWQEISYEDFKRLVLNKEVPLTNVIYFY